MTDKKTAVVTGANKGIGRETARRLALLGYTVWLGSRDASRGEKAAKELQQNGGDVRFLLLDVTDDESVKQAAAVVSRATTRLDALVNNAGVVLETFGTSLTPSAPSSAEIAAIKATYEVNVFGPVRVTQAFLPLLRASPAGRIVMVSSGLGSLAQQSDPKYKSYFVNFLGYNSSKSALNAVTVIFAKELQDTAIKVNAADPGYTATDMNGNSGTRTVEQGSEIVVRLAILPDDGPTGAYFNDEGPVPW